MLLCCCAGQHYCSALTLGVEGSALRERLPVTNAPPVEVLPKEMSVPVNISRDGLIINKHGGRKGSLSPLIHWSPPSSNSLEDNPLAVPDAGEVADAVETAAVRVAGPSDVQHSGQTNNNRNSSQPHLSTHLAAAQSEQLP